MKFFNQIDFEIKSSQMAGDMLCLQMDANSKLGPELIKGDPDHQSKNEKVLEKILQDNDLIVVNGTQLCEGVITRYGKTINNEEQSVINFFIVCRKLYRLIQSLFIDEKWIYHLTKYSDKKGNKNVKESDHNLMILNIVTNWKTSVEDKDERIEIYNYRNKDDFENL